MGDFRPVMTDTQFVAEAVARSLDILDREIRTNAANFGLKKLEFDLAKGFIECADAYDMANHLERCGWLGVNAKTIEALKAARIVLESAHRRAVRAWVKRVELRPGHRVGDEVSFVLGDRMWQGKIIGIFEQEGCYLIFSATLNAEIKPPRAQLLPWEQVDRRSTTTRSEN